MVFPDDLTVDEAFDIARDIDMQIADIGMGVARSIESGDFEEADASCDQILQMTEDMGEVAAIGGLESWVVYASELTEHVREIKRFIKEDREWDAFEGALQIPKLRGWYTNRQT